MKKISEIFLKGLLAVLPIAITLSALYWLGTVAESTLGELLKWLLPSQLYWPGMGLLVGFVFILTVGVLMNAYLFRKLASLFERAIDSIPLVKIIYNSVRDIAQFAAVSDDVELKKPVLVTFNDDIRLIGFITRKSITLGNSNGLMAVYLPMSYQIGGYTLMLPESRVEILDMDAQEAMRMVLTAGMASSERRP
ncbi:DUF502 domain-containing protein [Oceanicoccus sp. KOV_DT_Chl]|uniref:DUF502 domain-containing protein n=1 Tax=Oceanicoccus sp. KOV_DT_Chl TaxID=1904639 RepID=UPI000C7A8580|nr:DUF502 domain-containing protein [Oceanicoccus sp. KOV_DT_Chl]